MTDILTPQQTTAMFDAIDNAELAREERKIGAERRRELMADYLLAAEESDAAPRNRARAKTAAEARAALAAFLVANGEYPTTTAADDAIEHRQAYAMPKPGRDYSKVVPF
ncbi:MULTISPECIES: hypothetical protein [Glycomyces]|uniref:DUF222 domain-containing protein n=2 Tax=Glycomyces TaxID=58113 RepID=A0ABU2AHU1_9ACTN|nr:hypothetical protein [Glycomyces lechevalierae]MDR7336781.1 hypothetical protein [Glycomyces lechevalierae]